MTFRRKPIDAAINTADLRRLAQKRAHKMVFDYIDGGAEDEQTLKRNSRAFQDYRLVHKVLTGVETVDPSITLLGTRLPVPFILSPAAGNRLFHTEGERGVARAANDIGTVYSLSTLLSVSIEDVADLTSAPKWFQLYVWKDRSLVKEMLGRARKAGFTTLILTADFPITGQRERDIRNGFTIPPSTGLKQVIEAIRRPAWSWDYVRSEKIRYANLSTDTPATSLSDFVAEQLHADFNWRDAERVLNVWDGPAVLKGVMHPDDADRARDMGFAAVSISNHGGRQLDGEAAPLDMLPTIRRQVGPDFPLILDGGVRRGSDILKALLLGANAISFARPYLYGLAAGGYQGVRRALTILTEEFTRSMALAGLTDLKTLDATMLMVPRGHSSNLTKELLQ